MSKWLLIVATALLVVTAGVYGFLYLGDSRSSNLAALEKQALSAPTPELKTELLSTVRREMGPVAVVGELNFVTMLPKTRSGKIMRRVLRAVTLDRDPGDITTIEDEGSVDEARHAWERMKAEIRR